MDILRRRRCTMRLRIYILRAVYTTCAQFTPHDVHGITGMPVPPVVPRIARNSGIPRNRHLARKTLGPEGTKPRTRSIKGAWVSASHTGRHCRENAVFSQNPVARLSGEPMWSFSDPDN